MVYHSGLKRIHMLLPIHLRSSSSARMIWTMISSFIKAWKLTDGGLKSRYYRKAEAGMHWYHVHMMIISGHVTMKFQTVGWMLSRNWIDDCLPDHSILILSGQYFSPITVTLFRKWGIKACQTPVVINSFLLIRFVWKQYFYLLYVIPKSVKKRYNALVFKQIWKEDLAYY